MLKTPSVFHPVHHLRYFNQEGSAWTPKDVDNKIVELKRMYEKVYSPFDKTGTSRSAPSQPLQTTASKEKFSYDDDDDDDDDDTNAFDEYWRSGRISSKQYERAAHSSPLDFWTPQLVQPRRRPLAEMAIDFLSAPPTSCDAERAFSAGRRTVNDYQHRTRHDLLDAKVCVGNWAAPTAPFFGSVEAIIKKATATMTAEMRGKKRAIPAKRSQVGEVIEVDGSSDGDEVA